MMGVEHGEHGAIVLLVDAEPIDEDMGSIGVPLASFREHFSNHTYAPSTDRDDDTQEAHEITVPAYRAVSDRYDPDGSMPYVSIESFVQMVAECFGTDARDALDVCSDEVRDADGTVVLEMW